MPEDYQEDQVHREVQVHLEMMACQVHQVHRAIQVHLEVMVRQEDQVYRVRILESLVCEFMEESLTQTNTICSLW